MWLSKGPCLRKARYFEPTFNGTPCVALLIKWAVSGTVNDLLLFGSTVGAAFLTAHRRGVGEDPVAVAGGIALTVLSLYVYRRLHCVERYQNAISGV